MSNPAPSGVTVDVASSMNEYLDRSDWRVNANANQGYSLGGLILNVAGKVTANYWLSEVYPPAVGEAHRNGDVQVHDLDSLSGYCAGWSLKSLLIEGFNGVPNKVSSNPPRHLSSAVGQMVNFLGTLQNEWAGAQAFSSADTLLAPFVRKDAMSYDDVLQCIQELVYNLNVPSRWGTQTPFTNLTFDWTCPDDLKDEVPVIGGDFMDFTYGDLQAEMDMINKAYIEVMTAGDASGRVFTFPIPTYNITKEFDWDSENAQALFEMTAKYGVPYFQNFLNSDMKPGDVRSMCPLTGDTSVLVRSSRGVRVATIQEVVNDSLAKGTEYQVWTPKGWASAKPVKTPMTDVYEVSLSNGDVVKMGEDHLQPVRGMGTLSARDLKVGMWLPYNKDAVDFGTSFEYQPSRGDVGVSDEDFGYSHIVGIKNLGYLANEHLYCFEVDNSDHLFMLASGLVTHNCRLQLDLRELLKRGGGLFGSGEQTGSIGVVTVNMARLGYVHKGDKAGMFARLDELTDLAKESLELKRVVVQRHMDEGLYPYTRRYLGTLNNHFSTIGVNGINEMIRNFSDDEYNIADERGRALAVEVLDHIRGRMVEYQEETGNLYNLEATPAEGTTYRFAREDKKRFPGILQAGSQEEPYYTNSSQLPVGFTDDPFEALELGDELQTKYTGGTVLHLYMSERMSSAESCKQLVKRALSSFRLPYITVTPTFSICESHGYLTGDHETCPTCGQECERWSRVMGYFRPVKSFNIGKKGEFKERTFFEESRIN